MTGVARVALATGAPVIPVAQWGAQFSVDWYARKFRLVPRKKVIFQVGPPVDLSAYLGRPVTSALLRETTDAIMRAVRDAVADVRGERAREEFAPRPAARSGRRRKGGGKARGRAAAPDSADGSDPAPAGGTAPASPGRESPAPGSAAGGSVAEGST